MRGASNAVLSLSQDELKRGVATHSSGNHAAALSLAAKLNGSRAHIALPKTAPEIKKKAVKGYGAEITFCDATLESREKTLNEIIERTGAVFIHSYNNVKIIEGQATCAKEIYEDLNDLDYIVVPVGGGGLSSGTCLSTKYFSPKTKVIGAEPKNADDAYRSLKEGKLQPQVKPNSIADGLLTSLCDLTYGILKENIYEIITVSEESIIRAMRLVWERMKIIIEPSSATALAAVLDNVEKFKSKRVAIIISGGNVDLDHLPW